MQRSPVAVLAASVVLGCVVAAQRPADIVQAEIEQAGKDVPKVATGFDALLGGGRAADAQYDDLGAHGFYWTATEGDSGAAVYYNFGRGGSALYRQREGEKQMALAVRCVAAG